MIGEFSKEQEKFLSNNKVKKSTSDAAVPPWVGYNEEEAMKKQILDLSKVGFMLRWDEEGKGCHCVIMVG